MGAIRMKHLPLMLVNCVPHRLQRYDTCGDWYSISGVQHITISKMDSADKEIETALHEMYEWYLCETEGVAERVVDEWDNSHPELDDPGSHPDCPYRSQHLRALKISKIAVEGMGYNWREYCTEFDAASSKLSREKI